VVVVVAPRHQLHAAVAFVTFVAVSLMACCCCCTMLGVDDSGCAASEVEYKRLLLKSVEQGQAVAAAHTDAESFAAAAAVSG
jgi:hypothetical protein